MILALAFACSTEASPPVKVDAPTKHAHKSATAAPGLLSSASASDTSAPSSIAGLSPQQSGTGITYYVLRAGAGESPVPGQTVGVHYTGWLADGTKFDSSVDKGKLFVFPVGIGKVIKGWDESVLEMKVGEKRQIRVPPEMGYGERGAGGVIPPGATLTFDVELIELR